MHWHSTNFPYRGKLTGIIEFQKVFLSSKELIEIEKSFEERKNKPPSSRNDFIKNKSPRYFGGIKKITKLLRKSD